MVMVVKEMRANCEEKGHTESTENTEMFFLNTNSTNEHECRLGHVDCEDEGHTETTESTEIIF